MKPAFDTLDLRDPATYENNPELARLARRVAEKYWQPGAMSRGDFKREVLAGKHPDIVRAALEEQERQKQESAEAEKQGAKAATSVDLPAGYSLAVEGSSLVVSGPFDDDLHARIKRAGGRWDGKAGQNRRVWIVPASKGKSLKRVLANWSKANRDRIEEEAAARRAAEDAKAKARADAPAVAPGKYGPFTVKQSQRFPEKLVVEFRYDPDLVGTVKEAGSARFDPQSKVWLVDKADGAKLLDILDRGKVIAERKAAESAEVKRLEEESRRAEAEDRERKGISHAYYWADRMGYGLPDIGEVVKRGDDYHVVTAVSRGRYMGEDAMSFGGTDDRPYQHRVTLRRATEDEVAAVQREEDAARKKVNARKELGAIMREIQDRGVLPERAEPAGDVVLDTFNIHGGGERIIIGNDKVWYVRNNGMDGDDWSRNNVRTGGAGAIGWYVPKTPDIEQRIRRVIQHMADAPQS